MLGLCEDLKLWRSLQEFLIGFKSRSVVDGRQGKTQEPQWAII
jgi:hypothetical protein